MTQQFARLDLLIEDELDRDRLAIRRLKPAVRNGQSSRPNLKIARRLHHLTGLFAKGRSRDDSKRATRLQRLSQHIIQPRRRDPLPIPQRLRLQQQRRDDDRFVGLLGLDDRLSERERQPLGAIDIACR